MLLSPLHKLEKEAERKAQEYKNQLIEEGMKKLAAEKSAENPPPSHPSDCQPPDHSADSGSE